MQEHPTKDSVFPFTYTDWDEAGGDYGDIQFYKVEFVEDFGDIKKGETFDCVVIYHSKCQLVGITNGPMEDGGFRPQIGEKVVNFKVVAA